MKRFAILLLFVLPAASARAAGPQTRVDALLYTIPVSYDSTTYEDANVNGLYLFYGYGVNRSYELGVDLTGIDYASGLEYKQRDVTFAYNAYREGRRSRYGVHAITSNTGTYDGNVFFTGVSRDRGEGRSWSADLYVSHYGTMTPGLSVYQATLGTGRTTAKDLGIGLAVGVAVGLLAVPFTGPAAPAAVGTVVVGASQALVNEVLLRLFLVTSVAWLLLRWHRLGINEALVGAVVAATLVQVLLYAPGAAAIGFASWTGTALFLTVGVALPAAAFGVLFWRRGFATALIADVTALAAIALLA